MMTVVLKANEFEGNMTFIESGSIFSMKRSRTIDYGFSIGSPMLVLLSAYMNNTLIDR